MLETPAPCANGNVHSADGWQDGASNPGHRPKYAKRNVMRLLPCRRPPYAIPANLRASKRRGYFYT